MSPEKRDPAYLWDMLVAARKVVEFTHGLSYEAYLESALTRDAVERNLGIIGEAARHLSGTFKKAHTDLPWRSIVGLRNIVVHDYDNVDQAVIWEIVSDDIRRLIEKLVSLTPPVPPDEPE